MLTFSLNKTPPTPAEIGKERSRIKRLERLSLILFVLFVLEVLSNNIPGFEAYKDYKLHPAVYIMYFILMSITITGSILLFIIWLGTMFGEDLVPISKADCLDIEKALDQPLIANYCAQVGAQGRELVAGEKRAINRQMRFETAEILRLQTEIESEAACKRVYGIATS